MNRRDKINHIGIAVISAVLFFSVTVAHACVGMGILYSGGHHHGGIGAGNSAPTPHTEAQDENCRSLRDRLISVAPQPAQTHGFAINLRALSVMTQELARVTQIATAERPPGVQSIADDQLPVYLFNSVFRI